MPGMEITREVVLDASVDEVWELLTDQDELLSWLTENGEPGQVRFDEVVEAETVHRVRFTWWPEVGGDGAASEVTLTLDEAPRGARLRVRETARGGVSLKGRGLDASAWDDRLLGLELRCLARSSLAHC
jgi:uncharacterized protein YndB with AHSA1/START domain